MIGSLISLFATSIHHRYRFKINGGFVRIDGYTFCGLSYVQYTPQLDGQRLKIDESGKVGILAGEPWQDQMPGPDEDELSVVLSRIAIFEPIPPAAEEVFEGGGEGE